MKRPKDVITLEERPNGCVLATRYCVTGFWDGHVKGEVFPLHVPADEKGFFYSLLAVAEVMGLVRVLTGTEVDTFKAGLTTMPTTEATYAT